MDRFLWALPGFMFGMAVGIWLRGLTVREAIDAAFSLGVKAGRGEPPPGGA